MLTKNSHMLTKKFLALAVIACALAIAPAAFAAGLTATATPSHPKVGKNVQLKITGLKPNEKVKAKELIADGGQTRTLFPSHRANSGGVLVVTVRAEIKGKHTWTFTGRTSRRTGKTFYVVK